MILNNIQSYGNLCDQCIEICNLIGLLVTEEGSSVTILSANPEFIGPNFAIETTGDWTNWEPSRFEGDNILEALRNALKAMEVHGILIRDKKTGRRSFK